MPALSLNLALTAAAAAIAIGTWLCSEDDNDVVLHYSHQSSPRSTTRIQTQPSHRPPPLPQPPCYTYRPPATYAQATPRASAPPAYSCVVDQPRVVPPFTRTPSRTQPSATLTQQSFARTQPSIAQPASTKPQVPSRVPTERDRLLPTASGGGYHSSGVSTYARTPSQKQPSPTGTLAQPSSTRAHPPTTFTQSSSTITQPSSTLTRPSSTLVQPSSALVQPSSTLVQPSSTLVQPSSTLVQPSSTHAQPSSTHTRLSSTLIPPPPASPLLFDQTLAWSASTSSHAPSCLPAERDPFLPSVIKVVRFDVRSDEPATVEDLDFAEKLREEARRKGREISEAQNAKKELDKRAAEIIFREKNKVCSYMSLDICAQGCSLTLFVLEL